MRSQVYIYSFGRSVIPYICSVSGGYLQSNACSLRPSGGKRHHFTYPPKIHIAGLGSLSPLSSSVPLSSSETSRNSEGFLGFSRIFGCVRTANFSGFSIFFQLLSVGKLSETGENCGFLQYEHSI